MFAFLSLREAAGILSLVSAAKEIELSSQASVNSAERIVRIVRMFIANI